MLKMTNMMVATRDKGETTWTRVNRHNDQERSAIDYILTCEKAEPYITNITIDLEGVYRLKGQKMSDHNTITCTLDTISTEEKTKIHTWKKGTQEGWAEYKYSSLHKK